MSIDEKDKGQSVNTSSKDLAASSLTGSLQNEPINPFVDPPKDSPLDPTSSNFSYKSWLQNLTSFLSSEPTRYPRLTSGLSFSNLSVYGRRSPTDYQKDVLNILLSFSSLFRRIAGTHAQSVEILHSFDGLVNSGELLLVLGRPGSGCSTLLKTISCDTHGLIVSKDSSLNYKGISAKDMHEKFRGEAIYMAENDVHFPQLTVGDTLLFAAGARAPRDGTFLGVSREMYARHMRDVVMAALGIGHTVDTAVGNHVIKGVSGGEKKRVSIAEAMLSGSPLQCWDNSTRGLDSANALEFCRILKLQAEMTGVIACVSLYQASQGIYDIFDKVTVLYSGHQIYFGPASEAKQFFTNMGFEAAPRQTTADFLTSLTNPAECRVRSGFEAKVPRTPQDFVKFWKTSDDHRRLTAGIEEFDVRHPIGSKAVEEFKAARRAMQARSQRGESPYMLSIPQQVMLCVGRGFQRLKGDASVTISGIVANSIMALIVGSVFYNLQATTASFYSRGVLLFFAILLNAFASALEILLLYEQRPMVEKHSRYALYHPFTEAMSSMLCDLPYKITNCITFNLTLYFMTNLNRTPSAFFTFLIISFVTTLALSNIFRTIGASSRTLVQALCPAAIIILALMVSTGFVIPPTQLVPWFRWINYLDPISYAFESLMINEFDGRTFDCSTFVPSGPGYTGLDALNHVCFSVGSVPGSSVVEGSEYIRLSFGYEAKNLWRNFGIIIAFAIFFMFTYLMATEYIQASRPKGEVLLFRRGHKGLKAQQRDPENLKGDSTAAIADEDIKVTGTIQKQTSIFQWRDITFDIKVKKEEKRLLDHIDGYVRPGTLTCLFGPSGAGKTTLLDVLATRTTIGTVSGSAFVDGHSRDISFQRKTGYVMQADIHLETSTVREALRFSALLRQSSHNSSGVARTKKEKLEYVEEVIKLLNMENFADAIIGVPGEGLNIEQRKLLTIAAELAARPDLLLFLDEPSSGLDSQTAWSIVSLLEKLTTHGQAILCTIHQPSASLFQRFDRLLFIGPEGKPLYFGELGTDCETVRGYFERNGASVCGAEKNPAEWLMEIIGVAPGTRAQRDWHNVWLASPERRAVRAELEEMEEAARKISSTQAERNLSGKNGEPQSEKRDGKDGERRGKRKGDDYAEFAAPFHIQLWECLKRVNVQYWRSPAYIWSKTALCVLTGLFIGFSFFRSENTIQGIQNQTFSVFMLLTLSSNFVPQILPNFVTQRIHYETVARPSKTHSWPAFLLSNILVEIPWNSLMAVCVWAGWYFPVGFWRSGGWRLVAEGSGVNGQGEGGWVYGGGGVAERSMAMFALVWVYMMYTSTFAAFIQAGVELAEMAGNFANLLFLFSLIFCGILASPTALPGFWIFTYRLSPFTYLVSAILSTGLAGAPAYCSDIEVLHFEPPSNMTCGEYLKGYMEMAGGYLVDAAAEMGIGGQGVAGVDNGECAYCPVSSTDAILETLGVRWDERWRNFGIMFVYVGVNIVGAGAIYWAVRVPKRKR